MKDTKPTSMHLAMFIFITCVLLVLFWPLGVAYFVYMMLKAARFDEAQEQNTNNPN
jgi:hypothetical protein